MAYDQGLAERLRELLEERPDMAEKKMFGGIGWLQNGNMCVGIHKDYLVIRAGVEACDNVLTEPHTKVMDITGRPMKGWVMINPDGLEDDADLKRYTDLALEFVKTLPAK